MRCLTERECEEWLTNRQRRKPDAVDDLLSERISYPAEPHRVRFFSHWIAATLAEKAGVSVQAIYKLEQGRASARYETTRKLAKALEVHPSEIADPAELATD